MKDSSISWLDLYITDFGESQMSDTEEFTIKSKKARTFYSEFLLPLYKDAKNSEDFAFSVAEEELTCRIMYFELKEYYGLKTVEDVLYKISENKLTLNEEKINKLLDLMKERKGI